MNDADLPALLRDAVRDTHMTVPESDITRRAGTLRVRRWVAVGGAASAVIAAAALAAVALTAPAAPSVTSQNTVAQLTAWTVAKHPDGVIDVTIRELKDPAGLQARLRADGVPASITFSRDTSPACHDYYPGHPMPKTSVNMSSLDNGVFNGAQETEGVVVAIHPDRLPSDAGLQFAVYPEGTDTSHGVTVHTFAYEFGLVDRSPACTG